MLFRSHTASAGTPLRRWPRVPGLHVCTALGGRGLTLAPLLGRALAAAITGAPCPLEQALLDAVDPARWRLREERVEAPPALPGAMDGAALAK